MDIGLITEMLIFPGIWLKKQSDKSKLKSVISKIFEKNTPKLYFQEFEYVYYTGDIINHRVWETSIENNTKAISKLYSYFKDTFDVPVFPIFGNHEPHPIDL